MWGPFWCPPRAPKRLSWNSFLAPEGIKKGGTPFRFGAFGVHFGVQKGAKMSHLDFIFGAGRHPEASQSYQKTMFFLRSALEGEKGGTQFRFGAFGVHFGVQKGAKMVPKSLQKSMQFLMRFWKHFGSIFGAKIVDLGRSFWIIFLTHRKMAHLTKTL